MPSYDPIQKISTAYLISSLTIVAFPFAPLTPTPVPRQWVQHCQALLGRRSHPRTRCRDNPSASRRMRGKGLPQVGRLDLLVLSQIDTPSPICLYDTHLPPLSSDSRYQQKITRPPGMPSITRQKQPSSNQPATSFVRNTQKQTWGESTYEGDAPATGRLIAPAALHHRSYQCMQLLDAHFHPHPLLHTSPSSPKPPLTPRPLQSPTSFYYSQFFCLPQVPVPITPLTSTHPHYSSSHFFFSVPQFFHSFASAAQRYKAVTSKPDTGAALRRLGIRRR